MNGVLKVIYLLSLTLVLDWLGGRSHTSVIFNSGERIPFTNWIRGKRRRRDSLETIEKSVVHRILVTALTEQFQLK